MKNLLVAIAFSCFFVSCNNTAEDEKARPAGMVKIDTAQLGADDYGMKQYSLVFLKRGAALDVDADSMVRIQQAHLRYLREQLIAGKLLVVGPLLADEDIRGICIYNSTPDEAKKIAENDPALKVGHMVAEVFPWYGTASLQLVPDLHQQLEKKSFAEIQ